MHAGHPARIRKALESRAAVRGFFSSRAGEHVGQIHLEQLSINVNNCRLC